jgi:hypothetical protein
MANNAKAILITVLGVGAACVAVAVFMVAVIGLSLIAAAGEEENGRDKTPPTTAEKRRKQSGSGSSKSKADRGKELDYSSDALAPELIGKWQLRQGGGETDFTGKSRYRSHRRYFYEFAADGAVEYSMERETLTIMQCEIKERTAASGKASTSGDALTIYFGQSDSAASNSCEGGETTQKTLPAETVNLTWRLQTENEQTRLCFAEPGGEACYDKQD